MKAKEAIREIMQEQNVGLKQLSCRIGKPVNTTSERLRQENISVSKLKELLKVLDYKVVIMPTNGTLPKGGYEIE